MNIDLFDRCRIIQNDINAGNEEEARDNLLTLLNDVTNEEELQLPPIVGNLIRQLGLYPYLGNCSLLWQDRIVADINTFEVGGGQMVILHREQYKILSLLLNKVSVALSAPTSFGKSFIIDALINLKKPNNVVILVPTIALTDETRRRIYKKFSSNYKIITTPDISAGERNIYIFPQERVFGYLNSIKKIDLLVVDEFYKASHDFDKDRAHTLIKAIMVLGERSKQRYYLAPNISELKESIILKGMNVVPVDFKTVITKIVNKYRPGISNEEKYGEVREIVRNRAVKTLIYAGTYKNIGVISDFILGEDRSFRNKLLDAFSNWLKQNYTPEFKLSDLVKRGVGIHNGQLHRSISQIQIRLFEEKFGLNCIVSTSSIIEGVNTSAQTVVVWSGKNGRPNINNFTYKNIIGRGGRMFRHFVGNVILLDKIPKDEEIELDIHVNVDDVSNLPQSSIDSNSGIDKAEFDRYQDEMRAIVGREGYDALVNEGSLLHSESGYIKYMASEIKNFPDKWRRLKMLNTNDPESWDNALYLIIEYAGSMGGARHGQIVEFIKTISKSWSSSTRQIIKELEYVDVGINNYFDLEKNATYKLANALSTINTLIQKIHPQMEIDVTPFISKLSHAFLPSNVYHLEEYGMPRFLSRRIHDSGLIDMEESGIEVNQLIDKFRAIGIDRVIETVGDFDMFDRYVLRFFYDGIDPFVENTA